MVELIFIAIFAPILTAWIGYRMGLGDGWWKGWEEAQEDQTDAAHRCGW